MHSKTRSVYPDSLSEVLAGMLPPLEPQQGKNRFTGNRNDNYAEVNNYVAECGGGNPVTIRQATPDELQEFAHIKPIKRNNYTDRGMVTIR